MRASFVIVQWTTTLIFSSCLDVVDRVQFIQWLVTTQPVLKSKSKRFEQLFSFDFVGGFFLVRFLFSDGFDLIVVYLFVLPSHAHDEFSFVPFLWHCAQDIILMMMQSESNTHSVYSYIALYNAVNSVYSIFHFWCPLNEEYVVK